MYIAVESSISAEEESRRSFVVFVRERRDVVGVQSLLLLSKGAEGRTELNLPTARQHKPARHVC